MLFVFLKLWNWFINNPTADQLINKRQSQNTIFILPILTVILYSDSSEVNNDLTHGSGIGFSVKMLWSCSFKSNKFFIPAEREPDLEGLLMGKKNEEETPAAQKAVEPVEYMAAEQGAGGLTGENQSKKQPENIGTVHYPYIYI